MALNKEEQEFVDSIKNKIKYNEIPITPREALAQASGTFMLTIYNDNSTELVDTGVEITLIRKSFTYFLEKYCRVVIPGLGVVAMKPYYFQAEMAKEIENYRKIVVDKTRQCLTDKNFVMTDRGYISIKDVKVGDKIETIVNNKITFVDVIDAFYNGEKEVCRIMTNAGATVDCTLDHKLFTKRGWVEAGDLTLDDEIISIINKGSFGNFKLDDDRYAALIGYYLADGKYKQPCFVNTNKEYIQEVLEAGELFENCSPYIYDRISVGSRKQAYEVRLVADTTSNKLERPFRIFWNKFGLNVPSIDRGLTKDLMNLNEKQMSIMLNRLYAGDGWINFGRDKRRPNFIHYEIALGSPCYSLIKQIEYILQTKYGIHCYITESIENKGSENSFWRLRISQKQSVFDFINRIGIKGKTDTKEVIDLIAKENLSNSYQSFEKVRKIEKKEKMMSVYDITTESSDFLTNGLLVHNCGLSTIFSLYTLWKANFFSAENIDVISLKQMKAQQFIEKMKPTLKKLPEWMKTPVVVNNQKQISFKHSDGSISNIISEPQSENAGRSDSLSLLVMDELAFYASDNMVRGIISAATPTLSKTGGRVIMISTPNGTTGAGSYYYGQVQEAKQELHEDTKYIEIDWWEVPDDDRISGPKKGYNKVLKEAIGRGYYYNKLIKEDYKKFFTEIVKNYTKNSWLKSTYNDLGDIKFRQEILHEFVIEGDRVFGPDVMKRVYDGLKDPIIKDELWVDGKFLREQRGFWIWKHPKAGARYSIGVDVSSGTSSDTSTIQVLDATSMEQVAEFKGFISTPMFARLIKDVARIYNDGFVVIECNSIGDTIFSNVYYSENDPYGNVYKQKRTKNGITRFTGWITDVSTRKLMVKEFIDWVAVPELFEQFKINSSRLYNEMETWIWVGIDKAMHANNCLTGDTIITCKEGFKKIKDIDIGELVLTETGEYKPVREIFRTESSRHVLMEIRANGMPNLKISDSQRILTYKDKTYQYLDVRDLKKGNSVYSRFSTEVTNKEQMILSEIVNQMRKGIFKPSQKQLYTLPILQLELIRFMVRRKRFKKERWFYSYRARNYQSLYFLAHIFYRNGVIFSIKNKKITVSNNEMYRVCPEFYKKEPKQKASKKTFGGKVCSQVISVREISEEPILYDLNVEDVHSFVANGYIVHNCHDDAIMAMSLSLKLRDKAQLQEASMFIAEDGTVITYDRNAVMEKAKEEVTSFSSIDGTGKKKVAIKGGNSAGIMSNNPDEFGDNSLERKIKQEYNVSSIDELRWLLGG